MKKLVVLLLVLVFTGSGFSTLFAFEAGNVECIAPANPGGGWDFTCRQVGKTMYDLKLVPGPVQVTNMPGASGGVAFGYVVSKRNNDENLVVAASTSTTTRLAQGKFPGVNAEMVKWVGALGADYGIIAVANDSPIKNLADLMTALKNKPESIAVAGGSAVGGWDHFKVLMTAKAAGIENLRAVKYIAFQGGGEAITQLLGGHVQAFSGDVSEVQGHLESGSIRAIAVLSKERLPGAMSNIPTAVEQGIQTIAPNWRGFYVPKNISKEALKYWEDSMETIYQSPEWKKIMADNGLMPFFEKGLNFEYFVQNQIEEIRALSKMVGIIK